MPCTSDIPAGMPSRVGDEARDAAVSSGREALEYNSFTSLVMSAVSNGSSLNGYLIMWLSSHISPFRIDIVVVELDGHVIEARNGVFG